MAPGGASFQCGRPSCQSRQRLRPPHHRPRCPRLACQLDLRPMLHHYTLQPQAWPRHAPHRASCCTLPRGGMLRASRWQERQERPVVPSASPNTRGWRPSARCVGKRRSAHGSCRQSRYRSRAAPSHAERQTEAAAAAMAWDRRTGGGRRKRHRCHLRCRTSGLATARRSRCRRRWSSRTWCAAQQPVHGRGTPLCPSHPMYHWRCKR